MPSFRASLAVLDARPGVAPQAVLEAARAGVAASSLVEDAFVDVGEVARGGLPRVVIRFLVPTGNDAGEDASAWLAARDLATAVGQVAYWRDLRVFRRHRGEWLRLDGPDAETSPGKG